jgi:hypothetical protein
VPSLESWYRETLSHNTVLIDGISQPQAMGTLCRMTVDGLPHLADAAVEWGGVALRRIVLSCAEYFVDLFFVRCASPRRIDWIWHNAGAIDAERGAEPAEIGGAEAFRHLTGVRKCDLRTVAWRQGVYGMAMWLEPDPDESVYTGSSPANPPSELFGFLLRQRHASETTFIAVLHPYREVASVRKVVWSAPGRFEVEFENRRDYWDVSLLPDGLVGFTSSAAGEN